MKILSHKSLLSYSTLSESHHFRYHCLLVWGWSGHQPHQSLHWLCWHLNWGLLSSGWCLLPWPLLLQTTARKLMVYLFGLDFVPRRNKLLPLSNSAFPWFSLTSHLQFALLPAYSPLAWGPFLSPCCGLNHLTSLSLMLVSNLLPSPCLSGSVCSASSFSPSQDSKEESQATDILVAQTQPRLKLCKGKSGHMFIWLHILPVVIPLSTKAQGQKGG